MATDFTTGAVVAGRYKLERLLGEGGMGSVWLASHNVTAKRVALKFLKGDVHTPELRRRFIREAKAACAVEHPHVVEVHDVLELDDGSPVMVMEYLEGESLGDRLEREEKLSVREVAGIMLRVASAVGAAHAAGIVHRDLKPHNIFLTKDDVAVRVLDFGIAKLTPKVGDETETNLTATGALIGTPNYMAPEQVFGEKDIDHRIDIWALGLILYQCLTGILPTAGDNIGQVLKMILKKNIRPILELRPDVPADIADVLGRMLSRERQARPGDLGEVCAILARHTDVTVPEFRPTTPGAVVDEPDPDEVMADTQLGEGRPPSERLMYASTVATPGFISTSARPRKNNTRTWAVATGAAAVAALSGYWLVWGGAQATTVATSEAAPTAGREGAAAPTTPASTGAPTIAPAAATSSTAAAPGGAVSSATSSSAKVPESRPKGTSAPIVTATAVSQPSAEPTKTARGQVVEKPPF